MKTIFYINREHPFAIAMLKASVTAGALEYAAQHFAHIQNFRVAAVTAVAFCASALWLLHVHTNKNAQARRYGNHLEAAAIRALKKRMPKGWRVKTGIMSEGGGDIDAVVETDITTFAIEIKAYQGLKNSYGQLVKMNGDALMKDPLEQAQRAARTVGGSPVVWMPAAKLEGAFNCAGVDVVNGNADFLMEVLEQRRLKHESN